MQKAVSMLMAISLTMISSIALSVENLSLEKIRTMENPYDANAIDSADSNPAKLAEYQNYERFNECKNGVEYIMSTAKLGVKYSEIRKMSDAEIINNRLQVVGLDGDDFDESSGPDVVTKLSISTAVKYKHTPEQAIGAYWESCLKIPAEKFFSF